MIIPPAELDRFRNDLIGTLQEYRGQLAVDIGYNSLRSSADHLDTKLKMYEAALTGDSAKASPEAQSEAVISMNSSIEALAGQLRELALLVESCVKPTRPGEQSAFRSDLKEQREVLAEVKTSMAALTDTIEQVKRALAREPGGGVDSGPRGTGNRPYRCEPIVSVNEYRR
jgi:hypothetical protein